MTSSSTTSTLNEISQNPAPKQHLDSELESQAGNKEKEEQEEDKQQEKDDNVYPADRLSMPRQYLFTGTLCMAMFTHQIGISNTLATVGIIGESFGIDNPGQLSWLIAGFALTVGTFILIGGRLGDEFGHKKLFLIGVAWYSLWSLLAGVSVYSSHVLFVFARVFQGMGPALTLPNALAMLGSSYSPGPRQNMSFAWFAASAPFGAIAGFLFGGLFVLAWWPWIYWSQAIGLAAYALCAIWTIPSPPAQPRPKRSIRQILSALDVLGGVAGVLALVLFNFAWNQAVVVSWHQVYVYVCLILGVLFGITFFYIELRWAASPILPVAAFNSDIVFVFGCVACGWACFGIWIFYFTQMAISVGGQTPLQMAAWYTPVLAVGLMSALAVGKLIGKIPTSYIMVIGEAALVIASILAATRPVNSTYWTYFFFSTSIIVIGMDTSFPAGTILFSNAVPREYQGMGASITTTVVNYSISLGLGFAGTVETNINNGGLTRADKLHGYRGALWLGVGLAGLGLVLSLVFVAKEYWAKRAKTETDTP